MAPAAPAARPPPGRHRLRRRRPAGPDALPRRTAAALVVPPRLAALPRLGRRSLLLLRHPAPPQARLGVVRAAARAGARGPGGRLRRRPGRLRAVLAVPARLL